MRTTLRLCKSTGKSVDIELPKKVAIMCSPDKVEIWRRGGLFSDEEKENLISQLEKYNYLVMENFLNDVIEITTDDLKIIFTGED